MICDTCGGHLAKSDAQCWWQDESNVLIVHKITPERYQAGARCCPEGFMGRWFDHPATMADEKFLIEAVAERFDNPSTGGGSSKLWHEAARRLAETLEAEGYAFEAFTLLRLIDVDTEIAAAFDMKEAALD